MNNFIKFAFLSVVAISLTSHVSYASQKETLTDPNQEWFQNLRAKKSINEIYELRFDKESKFTDEQKIYSLYACALENHLLANLEIAEQIFVPYVTFAGSMDTKLERPDCHGALLPERQYSNVKKISTPTTPNIEELNLAKEFLKRGLKVILNPINNHDITITCGLGICGLRPYQPFADKLSLTQEESKELFHYWHKEYQVCKGLSKYVVKDDETLKFSDPYATTPFWIQVLYRNTGDTEFYLLVHQLLIQLNGIAETAFTDGLPWWRDHLWVNLDDNKAH